MNTRSCLSSAGCRSQHPAASVRVHIRSSTFRLIIPKPMPFAVQDLGEYSTTGTGSWVSLRVGSAHPMVATIERSRFYPVYRCIKIRENAQMCRTAQPCFFLCQVPAKKQHVSNGRPEPSADEPMLQYHDVNAAINSFAENRDHGAINHTHAPVHRLCTTCCTPYEWKP